MLFSVGQSACRFACCGAVGFSRAGLRKFFYAERLFRFPVGRKCAERATRFLFRNTALNKHDDALAELGVGHGGDCKRPGNVRGKGRLHFLYLHFYASGVDGVVPSPDDAESPVGIQFGNVVRHQLALADLRGADGQRPGFREAQADALEGGVPERRPVSADAAQGDV